MGTRPYRQNAILIQFIKNKRWMLSFVLAVGVLETTITYLSHLQQQNLWKSVATLLRNEVNSANSYQISRALSDMEQEGWIKCVKLVETTNETRIFYDTTTQSYCGLFANSVDGRLTAVNGSKWNLEFASSENIWLVVVRIIIPFLVALGLYYIYQVFDKQRKQQEAARLKVLIEKEFLLDLTRQTRHDIASPIGALKLVVQRINVAPEYSDLLRGIIDRIEGIFLHLKDLEYDSIGALTNSSLEVIDIGKLIKKIVSEKIAEWGLDSSTIRVDIGSTNVVANEIEMGRVISNLLNNSIEAKRSDTALRIKIDYSLTKKYCTIIFQDNGVGMSAEVLNNIGKKGYSFGKTKMNSGIGLYHAMKTIRAFGGDVKIESDPGNGSTIRIFLKHSQ